MNTVPIFLYHAITETPGNHVAPYSVTPDDFARQLDAILEAGYECVTFNQLIDQLHGPPQGRTAKPAVVTFDDGYADFMTAAAPALLSRKIPATIYLTTGWLEGRTQRAAGPSDAMLHWSQLDEVAGLGFEIGAHSHSHFQMDTLTTTQTRDELSKSKDLLEATLGHDIRSFAYPHGYNGPHVKKLTLEAGYESAAGVRMALSHFNDDKLNMARLMLGSDTSLERFNQWLGGIDTPVASSEESVMTKGWRYFRRTKAVVTRQPGSVYQ